MLIAMLVTGALALAVIPEVAPDGSTATAFKAKQVYLGDGRVIEDAVILVEDGVIRRVGTGIEIPEGTPVVEHDGVISPGLIALDSHEGGSGELHDATRPVLPEAELAHGFRPSHHDFDDTVAAGITTVVLGPTRSSLCPGVTAVVKTSGGKIVDRQGQLVLGFTARSLGTNEFPTSYATAIAEFGRLFDEGEGAFGRAKEGKLDVLFDISERDEIQRALAFAKSRNLKGALNGSRWAGELVDEIAASGLSVICDPADPGQEQRAAKSILALSKAGVPFCFGLGAPYRSPDALRFTSALAIRAGLTPAQVMKALTGDAAKIAGVAGRVGSIANGLDADLVFWSGDPTDLASLVVAVYIDGERVHGDER